MNLRADADVRRVACQRMVDGMASGRVDYEDFQSMQRSTTTPKLVRVLQGR